MTGAKLSQVTLTAQASYDGKQITSLPVQETVYPSLLLDPSNILIIGAAFWFTHTWGPADCTVEFSIGDQNIATTSMDGIAILGTTVQFMVPSKTMLVESLVPVYLYG